MAAVRSEIPIISFALSLEPKDRKLLLNHASNRTSLIDDTKILPRAFFDYILMHNDLVFLLCNQPMGLDWYLQTLAFELVLATEDSDQLARLYNRIHGQGCLVAGDTENANPLTAKVTFTTFSQGNCRTMTRTQFIATHLSTQVMMLIKKEKCNGYIVLRKLLGYEVKESKLDDRLLFCKTKQEEQELLERVLTMFYYDSSPVEGFYHFHSVESRDRRNMVLNLLGLRYRFGLKFMITIPGDLSDEHYLYLLRNANDYHLAGVIADHPHLQEAFDKAAASK